MSIASLPCLLGGCAVSRGMVSAALREKPRGESQKATKKSWGAQQYRVPSTAVNIGIAVTHNQRTEHRTDRSDQILMLLSRYFGADTYCRYIDL